MRRKIWFAQDEKIMGRLNRFLFIQDIIMGRCVAAAGAQSKIGQPIARHKLTTALGIVEVNSALQDVWHITYQKARKPIQ
jgi:hypothetical protein